MSETIEQQYISNSSAPIKKSGAKLATGLALIALLVACGGVAYNVLRAEQFTQTWQQENSTRSAQTADVLQQLQTNIANIQQQVAQQQAHLQAQQLQIQQLLLTHNHAQTSWILAEVGYLIQLANFNITYQHNPATALILLKAADTTLNKLNDPRLNDAHNAIISDMSKLASIPIVDKSNILLQLNTLSAQVANLPLINKPTTAIKPPAAATTADPNATSSPIKPSFWQRVWASIKAQLQKIVIIHHSDAALPPILTHVAQAYMQQDLQILLTQAQLAVMQGNKGIYQLSLTQVRGLIQQYYNPQANSVQNFLQSLQQLQAIDLTPALPALTASETAVVQTGKIINTAPTVSVDNTAVAASAKPVLAKPVVIKPTTQSAAPTTAPVTAPAPTQTPTPATSTSAATPAAPNPVVPANAPHTPVLPKSSDNLNSGHISTETAT